jgi:hypothetical protein
VRKLTGQLRCIQEQAAARSDKVMRQKNKRLWATVGVDSGGLAADGNDGALMNSPAFSS